MFTLTKAHAAWYDDGLEDGENCWRLDFEHPGYRGSFQAQVFATPADDPEERWIHWKHPWLFLERDSRDADGERRTDYACDAWALTDEQAALLLTSAQAAAVEQMAHRIQEVIALPCDERYTGTHDEQRDKLWTARRNAHPSP
jgi:hypothetical protein